MGTKIKWLVSSTDAVGELVHDELPAQMSALEAMPLIGDYVKCDDKLFEVRSRQWSWHPNGDAMLTMLLWLVVPNSRVAAAG